MTGIGKRFPGVLALDDVDFEVAPGEIHALLGENGAGKSTLLKILSGAQQPDAGDDRASAGETVTMATPHDAQQRGIVTIYQEFTLAPNMTIAENIFIGREPGPRIFVNWRKMAAETRAITDRLGLDAEADALVRDLSVAEQQMVEIARALSMKSRLIVMDEPTSALIVDARSRSSSASSAISRRRASSIIFVTHRLEEVMRLCDRYTVLRDGRLVGSGAIADTTVDGIIRLMVGREVERALRAIARRRRRRGRAHGRGPHAPRQRPGPHATVLDDVTLRGAPRRDPRHRRAGRRRPHRDGARGLRRRPVRFRPRHRSTASGPYPLAARRDPPRHRPGAGGPQAAGAVLALAVRINLSMAALDRHRAAGASSSTRRPRRALVEEFRRALNIRMAEPGAARRQPLRRQPAEGGARPLAGAAARRC